MDFAGWSIEPPLAYVVVAGLLYWLGGRGLRSRQQPLRTASFWAGMATIVLALDSPIDVAADKLFWAHMVQHVLLLTAAPPLILLGRPWPRMWRGPPPWLRAKGGRGGGRAGGAPPPRARGRTPPARGLFYGTLH